MILGVGIDLVSTVRIESLINQFKARFEQRIFTEKELLKAKKFAELRSRVLFFSKRFAAKEAFAKACGLGIGRGINFLDIEIENDSFGKPQIRILNHKTEFLKKHFNCEKLAIHLSLSDEKKYTTAMIIIEKIS